MNIKLTIIAAALTLLVIGFFVRPQKEEPISPAPPIAAEAPEAVILTEADGAWAEIPEEKIRFKIDENLLGLTYEVTDLGTYGKSISFSTKTLSAQDEFCIPLNRPLGSLEIYTQTQWNLIAREKGPANRGVLSSEPVADGRGFRVGNRYFSFIHPQAVCSASPAIQQIETQQLQSLQQAIISLELR